MGQRMALRQGVAVQVQVQEETADQSRGVPEGDLLIWTLTQQSWAHRAQVLQLGSRGRTLLWHCRTMGLFDIAGCWLRNLLTWRLEAWP